ncbi:hypothetical protein HMPREF1624_06389 [Sporothrix schenckii ATCC 58251]|uniref:Xylanolytic transcriptional activator regulatory domain-containing protein n=1 Tax=Sporothrix schenckii (strain ATCC 58251 / de Perez 2211183) TaxID=1391915 RepID=U7PRG8_SPOS1|nr:hypothetical protein HMPREF1624_06389 [Sporothrix schenckii ATCC 58251]
MTILGLEPGFSQDLIRLEKAVTLTGTGNTIRLRVIRQQEAIESLAAFSTYVHSWYPVLRPGFSERYFGVITGPLTPCPESCLVLLVTAIGALARQDHALGGVSHDGSDISEHYLDVAMISLPTVLADSSIESVQSLVLLSIYYNCLSRPWQAYQYAMIASFKVQNLLKCMDESDRDGELGEHARRAYWAVLLVESELCAHFDVVDSGIWKYDDELALPDSRRTWQFDVEEGSPESITTPPTRNILAANLHSSDKTHSYFLAEISMRRMLHRCNTAIRRTTEGEIVYAANIALELELQLDDWYGYLPEILL